jgi:hypothetical protein
MINDDLLPYYFAQKTKEFGNNRTNRRFLHIAMLAGMAAILAPIDVTFSSEKTYSLADEIGTGRQQRVQALVEVRGELKLNADGRKVDKIPLLVEGRISYDEKVVTSETSTGDCRAARHYHEATAKIKADETTIARTLNAERRLVVAHVTQDDALLFSPLGPLTRDELELIDIQANTLLLPALLPDHSVPQGGEWDLDDRQLARLFGLDVVTDNKVRCTLAQVGDGTAVIELAGTLEGGVAGVSTEIELKAKCTFDLLRRRINWFAVAMKENRDIGHAEPGFEVTARLQIAVTPIESCPQLDDALLAQLPINADANASLLAFESTNNPFRLAHDRRWRLMLDRHDLCVFRFVDRGDLLAQCNISPLPSLESGRQLTLEGLQQDVQKSLGERFGKFEEAATWTIGESQRVLRVVASGTASEIPIHWIFYHIDNSHGKRLAIAFTLEAKLSERFADQDRTLVESLEFTSPSVAEEAHRAGGQTTR